MIFNVKVTEKDFLQKYLSSINGTIGLSNQEMQILAALIDATAIYQNPELVFSTPIRKQIQERLNISSHTFSNYLSTLKQKMCIQETKTGMMVNSKLFPTIKEGKATVVFNFIFGYDGSGVQGNSGNTE